MTFLIKNVKQLENAKQKPYFSETEQTLLSTLLSCIFQTTLISAKHWENNLRQLYSILVNHAHDPELPLILVILRDCARRTEIRCLMVLK